MNKKVIVGAGALVGLLLFASASILIYRSVSSVNLKTTLPPEKKPTETAGNQSTKAAWVSHLAEKGTLDYLFPAAEMQIRLELIKRLKDEEVYRIVIDDIDNYKFFCINQVLSSNDIKYSYYRQGGFIRLVVTTADRAYMEAVLGELKEYGIDYTIERTLKRG